MPLTKPEEIDGEEAPEPPEPSDPKTEVTDREVAVETDAVAGETLREALESQATLREQVGGDVFPSLARLKEENEALKSENKELRKDVEVLEDRVQSLHTLISWTAMESGVSERQLRAWFKQLDIEPE
jgi:predicted RNase H-like nuclease (RuvC/YqgF family)